MLCPLSLIWFCSGNATLLELSDNLIEFSKEEKCSINSLFERESRRERIISTNLKEMQTCNPPPPPLPIMKAEPDYEDKIELASEHYFRTIKEERDLRALKMKKIMETQEKYIWHFNVNISYHLHQHFLIKWCKTRIKYKFVFLKIILKTI